jgi:hypothetical protein
MAHSYDRTLLARLGFADPDKTDPKHDLACQYLANDEQSRKLAEQVCEFGRHEWTEKAFSDRVEKAQVSFEVPVSKGEGRYKTTIGFLDLLIKYYIEVLDSSWPDQSYWERRHLVVEVKSSPVSAQEILRQINLYQEYYRPTNANGDDSQCQWGVAVNFDLSSASVEVFRSKDILPIRLGKRFEEWVAEQREMPVSSAVVEL